MSRNEARPGWSTLAWIAILFLLSPLAHAEFYIDDSGRIYERVTGTQYSVADHRHPYHVYLPEDESDGLRPLEGSKIYVKTDREAKIVSAYYSDKGELQVIYSWHGNNYLTNSDKILKANEERQQSTQ